MADSVTTSEDRKSQRPTKRRALTPVSQQSSQIEALFANPDREIKIPSGPVAKVAPAPPEIVTNVQGSSAGAGSGEFHVYKASRRREYERLRIMDEETAKEKADEEHQRRREELQRRDQEALDKNRAKREKAKQRKQKKARGATPQTEDVDGGEKTVDGGKYKRKLDPLENLAKPSNGVATEDTEAQPAADQEVGIVIHDDD